MSGDPRIAGPLSALAVVISDTMKERQQRHASVPPQQINVGRAVTGAGLLTGCAYVALCKAPLLGQPFAVLAAEFERTPSDPHFVFVVWIAASVFGAGSLRIGWRGAQDGPDAGYAAFLAAAWLIGGSFVVWSYAPGLIAAPGWGRCACWAAAVMCAMRFWIAMRRGVSAQDAVQQHIGENKVIWKS